MKNPPKDQIIRTLWDHRRKLLDQVQRYNDAITSLQALCTHENEVDVSYHGSPSYECPDCGKGMLP